jgi:hypothetical protein
LEPKNERNVDFDHFGRFLATEFEFSYEAVQTVNLLALRLQWFESTPAHTSPFADSAATYGKPSLSQSHSSSFEAA